MHEEIKEKIEEYGTSELPWTGGFILKDGTVIEIGDGTDHRIIDIELWSKCKILTYRIHDKGTTWYIRVNAGLSDEQIQKLLDRCGFIRELHLDVYDEKEDNLIFSKVYYNLKVFDLEDILKQVQNIL